MTLSKEVTQDLYSRTTTILKKQELLKDYIAQLESVQEIDEQIKELQEVRKAFINADTECFAVVEEIKALNKELNQAVKVATKGLSFKPAITKAFIKAQAKSDEEVAKVKDKGNAFSYLEAQFK